MTNQPHGCASFSALHCFSAPPPITTTTTCPPLPPLPAACYPPAARPRYPQGRVVPCEFIGVVKSQQSVYLKGEVVSNHDELMCNYFAQVGGAGCVWGGGGEMAGAGGRGGCWRALGGGARAGASRQVVAVAAGSEGPGACGEKWG